jgi:hypothetical protein
MKKTLIFGCIALAMTVTGTASAETAANNKSSRFVVQCEKAGDTTESCIEREKAARKTMAKVRREKRMKFVKMIIDSKIECNSWSDNREEIRICFRAKVKAGVKEMVLEMRDYKKECKQEGKIGIEIKRCSLEKYTGMQTNTETEVNIIETTNTEPNDTDDSDEEQNGDDLDDENTDDGSDDDGDEEVAEDPDVDFDFTFNEAGEITFVWQTENVDSCTASASPAHDEWTGEKSVTGGNETIDATSEETTFTLTCTPTDELIDPVEVSVVVEATKGE